MKLRTVTMRQFRKFDDPHHIDGLDDGLNLIAGPNEMGKSTVLAAIGTALFANHASKAELIKGLQPNHLEGAAPQLSLDFELRGRRHRIEKRFLRRPMARLTLPDGRAIENAEAEAALQRLLCLEAGEPVRMQQPDWPGYFKVIFAPQTHSFTQPSLTSSTRASLEGAIAAEIDRLSGGDVATALLQRIENALHDDLIDRKGVPKKHFKQIIEDEKVLGQDIARLEQERLALAEDIAALAGAEEALLGLDDEATNADALALQVHEARLGALIARRQTQAAVNEARYRLASLRAIEERRIAIDRDLATIRAEREQAAALVDEASLRAQRSRERGLAQKEQLECARREQAAVETRLKALESLCRLLARQDQTQIALDAIATKIEFRLEEAALAKVRLSGRPIGKASHKVQVLDHLQIHIDGIGEIEVRSRAEDLERMRANLAAVDAEIAAMVKELDLGVEAPAEIQACLDDAGVQLGEANEHCQRLEADLMRLREQWQDDHGQLQAAKAALEQIERRAAALERDQNAFAPEDEASQLTARIAAATLTLNEAEATLGPAIEGDNGGSLDALQADIRRRREALAAREQVRTDARLTIARLRGKVQALAGQGLTERQDALCARQAGVTAERIRIEQEVAALKLLRKTLQEAEAESRAYYLGPVVNRLEPYVRGLFPNASITINDAFKITTIARGKGFDERFEQLSDGTKEQIAVLARLAFAEMLHDQGLPAVVVLDDALVFADDRRLGKMFEILARAAEKLQIIILTCRENRFIALPAKRIAIEPLADLAEPRRAASF